MKKQFDFEAIEDFDKHISMSIPNYTGLVDVFTAIYLENMPPSGLCVDIGCSTGKFLNTLPTPAHGRLLGCDIADVGDIEKKFEFKKESCVSTLKKINHADVIISMFTLQFLGCHNREATLKELRRLIDNGATLLIAEKNYCSSPKINSILAREHLRQKRKNFTDTEIMDKDYQLFGSMFCLDKDEMEDELISLGEFEQVWQSYQFKGWVVHK